MTPSVGEDKEKVLSRPMFNVTMMTRNIVVFCLDTVRKDYFEDYAKRIIARSGFSFDRWYSSSSWTVASHGTMFTSDLPSMSGINVGNFYLGDVDKNDTFLSKLNNHRTICGSANGFIDPAFNVDSLFDEFLSASQHQRFDNGMDISDFTSKYNDHKWNFPHFVREALTHEQKLKSLANGGYLKTKNLFNTLPVPSPFDDGSRYLQKQVEETLVGISSPVFMFVNLMEAHGPHQYLSEYDRSIYSGPLDWSSSQLPDDSFEPKRNISDKELEYFRELYGAAIDYLDRRVISMIESWKPKMDGETTFLITSDHGENLGHQSEDYRVGHEDSLSEAVIHVPMEVINPPDDNTPNSKGLFSHRDFGDLVVGLSNNEWEVAPREIVASERIGTETSQFDPNQETDRMIRAAVRGREKYIWDSAGEKTQFKVSPNKPSDQFDKRTEVEIPDKIYEIFPNNIDAVLESISGQNTDVPKESVERLRNLGYL